MALYLPPIIDPFGHEAVNVEQQQQIRSSLDALADQGPPILTRPLAEVTSRSFGRGTIAARIYVHIRDQVILCVCHVSETTHAATLNLTACAGRTPLDLFGGALCRLSSDQPYLVIPPATVFTG